LLNQIDLDDYGVEFSQSVLPVPAVLSPQTWPFSLEWLPDSAFLVGGSVRDALLGRESEYLDLDFVLPAGAVETARAIARWYKAGFVLLDAERQIARVVFPQGTADFAAQVGSTLEADLNRRDFTVNAIAYNPHTDQILDPLQGYADLQQQRLRMVCAENLEEDPLRLLRAYRQAAQLGFSLEPQTRTMIRQLAPLLRRIAAERVQSELNYLLSAANGTSWLTAAWEDGLLQDWFPSATAESLERVAAADRAAVIIREVVPAFATELYDRIRNSMKSAPGEKTEAGTGATSRAGTIDLSIPNPTASGSTRNWLTLAKLTCLLSPTPAIAETQLRHLKYSRSEIQSASTILKYLPQLIEATRPSERNTAGNSPAPDTEGLPGLIWSAREQCLFFQHVGSTFPAVVLLAIAAGVSLQIAAEMMHRFVDSTDAIAHPTPLVTGQDLMNALHLPAGPQIGGLLAELQLTHAEGKITTAAGAIELAASLVQP